MSWRPSNRKQQEAALRSGIFRLRYIAATIVLFVSIAVSFTMSTNVVNPTVQEYFSSIESQFGYWLLLGNTRHHGLYPKGQLSPFPISKALRAMEEKLYTRLGLKAGARVLDAGAGSGYVAMYMAKKGLFVNGIDITPIHLVDAEKNIKANGLEDKITIQRDDYHNLTSFPDNSFDGIYTMETFVHADDPSKVLKNFYRLLKPGGVLVQHEYDFNRNSDVLQDILRLAHSQNTLQEGEYEKLLTEIGFKEFSLEDLTAEVLPMSRFFGIIGYVPYQAFKFFRIQDRFVNVMTGVEAWMRFDDWRYISVRAVKP